MFMSQKQGMPKVGRRNARKITRRESEITGLPRWVEMYTSPATGEVSFKNANIVGGGKTVNSIRNKLDKFYHSA
jgi:hypothetical protein